MIRRDVLEMALTREVLEAWRRHRHSVVLWDEMRRHATTAVFKEVNLVEIKQQECAEARRRLHNLLDVAARMGGSEALAEAIREAECRTALLGVELGELIRAQAGGERKPLSSQGVDLEELLTHGGPQSAALLRMLIGDVILAPSAGGSRATLRAAPRVGVCQENEESSTDCQDAAYGPLKIAAALPAAIDRRLENPDVHGKLVRLGGAILAARSAEGRDLAHPATFIGKRRDRT